MQSVLRKTRDARIDILGLAEKILVQTFTVSAFLNICRGLLFSLLYIFLSF